MQDNARKITYGAMMIAMFAILLAVSVYIPILGSITLFFTPLPFILYRLRYDRAPAIFVTVTGMFLSILGGVALIPFALLFGILGFVIGDTVRLGKSKLYTFMASGLTILVITILTYAATVLLLGINVIDVMMESLRESQEMTIAFMERLGEIPEDFTEQLDNMMQTTLMAIPSAFIIASFTLGFIIVLLNMAIAKRIGYETPKFQPFRAMKLPHITVWCYLIILLLPLMTTLEEGSTLALTYINASVILRFLFLLQGISFIHHYMFEMKLPRWGTILSTILAILLSPITTILGILDTGVNLRAWIGKNKSN